MCTPSAIYPQGAEVTWGRGVTQPGRAPVEGEAAEWAVGCVPRLRGLCPNPALQSWPWPDGSPCPQHWSSRAGWPPWVGPRGSVHPGTCPAHAHLGTWPTLTLGIPAKGIGCLSLHGWGSGARVGGVFLRKTTLGLMRGSHLTRSGSSPSWGPGTPRFADAVPGPTSWLQPLLCGAAAGGEVASGDASDLSRAPQPPVVAFCSRPRPHVPSVGTWQLEVVPGTFLEPALLCYFH